MFKFGTTKFRSEVSINAALFPEKKEQWLQSGCQVCDSYCDVFGGIEHEGIGMKIYLGARKSF
jgi:hypothetical protein